VPELPEVEVVRRGADTWFVDRRIRAVQVLHHRATRRHLPGPDDFAARLVDARILATQRRGKYFWFRLDTGEALVTHLGMSGQLRVASPSSVMTDHLRIRIEFDDDRDDLIFVDQRTFGGMFVDDLVNVNHPGTRRNPYGPVSERVSEAPAALRHIAPDPFDPLFDQSATVRRIRTKQSPIKAVILDQSVISGIGNIYADESLWRTRLDWQRSAASVSRSKVSELIDNARDVMSEALAAGGTSFDSLYVNVNGSSGYFSRSLAAYGRQGQPCLRCGAPISREHFANRSSFRCPRCQRRASPR
jgi:formamidopyrimidine-DNA glycosylase